jgi:hypothetical protein
MSLSRSREIFARCIEGVGTQKIKRVWRRTMNVSAIRRSFAEMNAALRASR